MKILLLSMTCGEGHNSIAKAVNNYLENRGVECKIVDIYRSDKKRQKFNNDAFLWALKHIPNIYQMIWRKQKARDPNLRYEKGIYNNDIDHVIDDIESEIKFYKPNAIICTHNYASGIVSKLRHLGKIDRNIFLYSILTDFFPHPYWESSVDVDKVFIPNSFAIPQMIEKGFKKEQLIETGLPINAKFYQKLDKNLIKEKLSIKQDFVIMVASGGYGIGNNDRVVKNILKTNLNVGIINLNGKNEKSKKKIDELIKKKGLDNVYNFGFVNNVDELMSASDLIVGRSGCVTLTEAICKSLPIIVRENVKMNEIENADILVKENIAIRLKSLKQLRNVLKFLYDNPQVYEQMKQNCEKQKKLNSCKIICEYVIENNIKSGE